MWYATKGLGIELGPYGLPLPETLLAETLKQEPGMELSIYGTPYPTSLIAETLKQKPAWYESLTSKNITAIMNPFADVAKIYAGTETVKAQLELEKIKAATKKKEADLIAAHKAAQAGVNVPVVSTSTQTWLVLGATGLLLVAGGFGSQRESETIMFGAITAKQSAMNCDQLAKKIKTLRRNKRTAKADELAVYANEKCKAEIAGDDVSTPGDALPDDTLTPEWSVLSCSAGTPTSCLLYNRVTGQQIGQSFQTVAEAQAWAASLPTGYVPPGPTGDVDVTNTVTPGEPYYEDLPDWAAAYGYGPSTQEQMILDPAAGSVVAPAGEIMGVSTQSLIWFGLAGLGIWWLMKKKKG